MDIQTSWTDGEFDKCRQVALKALLLSISLFCLILWGIHPRFYVNDDSSIQAILSGALTGSPTPYTVYVNYALCWMLVQCYKLFPGIAWFFVMLETLQFLVLFCWCYMTLRIVSRRLGDEQEISHILGMAITFASGLAGAMLPVQTPSFTLCSASLSAMGCALYFLLLREDWLLPIERRLLSVLSCFMLAMGCIVRFEGGLVGILIALALLLLHCLLRLTQVRSNDWAGILVASVSKGLLIPVIAAVFILGAQAIHKHAYSTPEWTEFQRINLARSSYMDYPHDSYEDNPDLYERVGWDEALAAVVKMWFFMDERVNAEAFSAISQGSTTKSASHITAIQENYAKRTGIFVDNMLEVYLSLLIALGATVSIFSWKSDNARIFAALLVFCAVCATVYIAMRGRFIFRGVYCALLPSLYCLWFLSLLSTHSIPHPVFLHHHVVVGLCAGVIAACIALVYTVSITGVVYDCLGIIALIPFLMIVFAEKTKHYGVYTRLSAMLMASIVVFSLVVGETRRSMEILAEPQLERVRQMDAVVEYADNDPSSVFIYPSFIGSTEVFQDYTNNLLSWGGWGYFAPWKKESLARSGFPDGLTGYVFFDEDVYFVSPSRGCLKRLRKYLSSITEETVSCELVKDFNNGIEIYSFHIGGDAG